MPILLPGLVVLSRRARYLSYSLLLIDEFHRRGGSSQNELGRFVRRGEFDLLLAVRQCTNPRCGVNAPATVGYFAVSDSISKSDGSVYERGESVKGDLGGYGQQYRSLLIALDLVAERGLNYQSEPLKIDRITTKARPVVEALQTAVAGTTWYRTYLGTEDPIPREAVLELSEAVCLCRLKTAEPERTLLHQALFGIPGAETLDQLMRIRGFALTLEGLGLMRGLSRAMALGVATFGIEHWSLRVGRAVRPIPQPVGARWSPRSGTNRQWPRCGRHYPNGDDHTNHSSASL